MRIKKAGTDKYLILLNGAEFSVLFWIFERIPYQLHEQTNLFVNQIRDKMKFQINRELEAADKPMID